MTPKSSMFSQKKVRSILSISIVALGSLYIFFMQRIAHLERNHRLLQSEHGTGASMVPLPSQSQTSPGGPLPADGCAYTLLYYYMYASLLWSVILLWRRRTRTRLISLLINVAIIFISDLQLGGDGYCDTTSVRKWETAASIFAKLAVESRYDSYSPKQIMDDNIRIAFRLHDQQDGPSLDKFAGVLHYTCAGQAPLPLSLSQRTILNFTTTISSDLKIAFIGDSIAEQLSQAYDAAVLGNGHERNRLAQTYSNGRGNANIHNCLSAAAPIRGGGVTAFWRVATLMSMSTHDMEYQCAHKWKKWNENQALALVDHRFSDDGKELDHRYFRDPDNESNITSDIANLPYHVAAFDATVLRVPHGWLTIEQITEERIVEAINLANEFLGVKTVVVSTLGLNNNVVTPKDWEDISNINEMIRNIAKHWVPRPGNVEHILVQEFGNFTNQILFMNAKHIKLTNENASTPDFSQKGWELAGTDFLLKRLSAESFWASSISMICAEQTYPSVNEKGEKVEDCIRSKISRDGAHWCVETIGPRYAASLACLLGCVFNGKEPSLETHDIESVRRCEQACNDRFMSIFPVEKEWIESQMTVFSKSA